MVGKVPVHIVLAFLLGILVDKKAPWSNWTSLSPSNQPASHSSHADLGDGYPMLQRGIDDEPTVKKEVEAQKIRGGDVSSSLRLSVKKESSLLSWSSEEEPESHENEERYDPNIDLSEVILRGEPQDSPAEDVRFSQEVVVVDHHVSHQLPAYPLTRSKDEKNDDPPSSLEDVSTDVNHNKDLVVDDDDDDDYLLLLDSSINIPADGENYHDDDIEKMNEEWSLHSSEERHPDFINQEARFLSVNSAEIGSFQPLTCNALLDTVTDCSSTVSSMDLSSVITIPCGECWTWDLTGEQTLKGLDIEGKLIFPDNHVVNITTPYVFVQGELVIPNSQSTIEPGNVGVSITLVTKSSGADITFRPSQDPNRNVCEEFDSKRCNLGKMPFLIAGGRVTIQAFPSSCDTWTTVKDVNYVKPTKDAADFTPFHSLPDSCPTSGLLFFNSTFDGFDDPDLAWHCRRGSLADIESGALTCSNRHQTFQGPYIDLTRLAPHDCLLPDTDYLFTTRIKLDAPGKEGQMTPCSNSSGFCPRLRSWFGDEDHTVQTMSSREAGNYGEWVQFTGVINLVDGELLPENDDWGIFYFRDVEPGTDFTIDYFMISLPTESSYADPDDPCGELVLNGDAEANWLNPYPMTKHSYSKLDVIVEDGNNFFRSTERNNYYSSIRQKLNPLCFDQGVRYFTSIDVRIHSKTPQPSSLRLRIERSGQSTIYRTVLLCPPQSYDDGFVTCSGSFPIDKKMSEGTKIEFYHQIDNSRDGHKFTVDYDNVSIRFDKGYAAELVVNKDATSCWGTGSTIHVTSSTLYNYDKQGNGYSGLITSIRREGDDAVIELAEAPFDPIVSETDSADFAAEVALVSRNVKIQGEMIDDSSVGAYLMLLHTQTHVQTIEGIEFRRMGQLDEEDRFPIHSLFNGNLDGSKISKNSIVDSFHRGIVVEGTSNLTLSQNIGVLNQGHFFYCRYSCEANDFIENLVSQTKDISRDDTLSGQTDYDACAFFIRVPNNNFYGNIAAGGDASGFYITADDKIRGEDGESLDNSIDARDIPLGAFIDNVAHSNKYHGMDYNYYEYYNENAARYSIDSFRSFKNLNSGLDLYKAWRGTINNSIFADNKYGIDVEWTDDMEILNSKFLGMTDLTLDIIQSPHFNKICKWSSATDVIFGVRSPSDVYNSWKIYGRKGARFENVLFSDFDNNECSSSFPVGFRTAEVRDSHWDYLTSYDNVTFKDDRGGNLIDGCSVSGSISSTATTGGVRDVVITDVGGSSHPSMIDNVGPGSFVSSTVQMTTFAKGTCTRYSSMCLTYCEETCLRTVRFNVDQYLTDKWTMNVVNEEGKQVFIGSKYQYDNDLSEFTEEWNSRLFAASLPSGTYEIRFLNQDGEKDWPRFALETWEEVPECDGHAGPLNISVIEPVAVCDNVFINGDIEDGMNYWLETGGSLEVNTDGGIGGSKAIMNTGRSRDYYGPIQNLDTRCFHTNEDNYFEIKAWIRLEDSGSEIICDPNSDSISTKCGEATLYWYYYENPKNKVETDYSTMDVAKPIAQYELADGFTMLHGVFKIDSDIASAERINVRFQDVKSDYDIILDNMTMTPFETKTGCDGDLIRNGNFDDGTSMYWKDSSSSTSIIQVSSENYAIRNFGRNVYSDDIRQYFYFDCLQKMSGHRYAAKAKFKLENTEGTTTLCDMKATNGDLECAYAYIYSRKAGYLDRIGQTVSSIDNEWNLITGTYTISPEYVESGDLYIRFREPNSESVIYDDISFTHIPFNCQSLTLNPSFEDGDGSFWLRDDIDDSSAIITSPGADSSSYALLFEHTSSGRDYLYQKLDSRCFVEDTTFKIQAKFKLFDKTNPATAVGCIPSVTSTSGTDRCPVVRIRGTGCTDPVDFSYTFRNEIPFFLWNTNTFNDFEAELPVDANLASCDDVRILVGYYLESTKILAIDDVTITRTATTPTELPTRSPTSISNRDPTSSPTFITYAPTVTSTSCGLTADSDPVELSEGQNFILSAAENILCTLTKVTLDQDNSIISVVPVARSYDGFSWEIAGGTFAASLSYGDAFFCYENGCQFFLPSIEANEAYYLTPYSHSRTEQDEIVRFLETTTFGPRKDEINSFSTDYTGEYKFSQWMMDQMDVDSTSHREYFRKRSNARLYTPVSSGIPDHPCDSFTRWRKFSFVNIDYPEESEYRRPIRITGSGPFIISRGGHDLTVADIRIPGSDYEDYPFDETYDHYICSSRLQMRVDGALYLRLPEGECARFYNPAINFTMYEHLVTSENLITFSDWSDLDPLDGNVTDAEEFFLPNGYSGSECTSIPATTAESPFIFGKLPDSSWVVYDPHFDLSLNTDTNPLDDGGIDVVVKSSGVSYCSNAPRNFLNEENCVLSQYACGSSAAGDEIEFVLNETTIVELQEKSGKYVYGIFGLPAGDLQHPCTNELRSRWEIKDSNAGCDPTELYPETEEALAELLTVSDDDNPFIRDVYFSDAVLSCNSSDYEVEIEIEVDDICYKRVHDEHLSVYDMTYWTAEDTHPGNAYAAANGNRNPIKKWADDGLWYLTFPSEHPVDPGFNHEISRWDNNYQKFSYVGRFGDEIRLRDLPTQLKTDEVIQHFGAAADISGAGVLVCGSVGEVANDKSLGSIFDYHTGIDRYVNFGHGDSRIFTWVMIALTGGDQLRQRIAWAISQIIIVVKDHIRDQRSKPEWFVYYYDIFVRNAFGNYRDILKEISYSPLMAENLSYLRSKSFSYMWERYTVKVDADENFAREIMQLFSIGTIELNIDGTPKLDSSGKTILTYTNDNIMSFAKAWTGFETENRRGNLEHTSSNQLDLMRIEAPWRDRFPKTNLYGGYIGDLFPLCVDFADKMFLRKGAHYKFLGSSNIPESMYEPSEFATDETIKLFTLEEGSALKELLCNDKDDDGNCDFETFFTLDTNLECTGIECQVDTVRVVEVETGIFYEYYPLPCVQQLIYEGAIKISPRKSYGDVMCGNPKLPVASEACCELGDNDADRFAVYDGERMMYNSAEDRCETSSTGAPLGLCNFYEVDSDESYKIDNYFWTKDPCKLQVKVASDGHVAVVHEPSTYLKKVLHVNDANENFFKAYWYSGSYPSFSDDCSGVCQSLAEGSCLCETSVQERQVFYSMPNSIKDVLSTLIIGSLDPSTYDEGTYSATVDVETNITAHMKNDRLDKNTIFEFVDSNGITRFMKNSIENVQITGPGGFLTGYSFRNAPHFMSLTPDDETSRDAAYETDAVLDHFFYHDNTAPFISIRMIQRLVTSNPSPRYVKTVASAFKAGLYEVGPHSFGTGAYGDLKATVAAILLDREARSVILDADPTHGALREPLLKVIGFMRSMEFINNRKFSPIVLDNMERKIGQMAHESPTVFSFFLPEFQPAGRVGEGSLVAPESTVLDMPTVIGFVNGMFSMVRYGLSRCDEGFGRFTTPCSTGYYDESDGFLSYNSSDPWQ